MKISGRTISPGVIIAPAFCLHTVEDIQEVPKDSIVIAKTLSVDLISIFDNAIGFVTEYGGITSHPAIVCREMKIPAITNIENALKIIQTLQVIELNTKKNYIKLKS